MRTKCKEDIDPITENLWSSRLWVWPTLKKAREASLKVSPHTRALQYCNMKEFLPSFEVLSLWMMSFQGMFLPFFLNSFSASSRARLMTVCWVSLSPLTSGWTMAKYSRTLATNTPTTCRAGRAVLKQSMKGQLTLHAGSRQVGFLICQ